MSSREPLWYCHECHAEMRPLMTPDPICASCRGTFVEKLENPADDPRDFQNRAPPTFDPPDDLPGAFEGFSRPSPWRSGGNSGRPSSPPRSPTIQRTRGQPSSSSGLRFEFHSSPGGGSTRTFILGGPDTLDHQPFDPEDRVPNILEFLRRGPDNTTNTRANGDITGPLMAQYLLSMFGREFHGQADPFAEMLGMPQSARWGDYVFNQEALDQILAQLAENSTGGRPVPATEEIVNNLSREVLTEGSPLLEKDCAVCKESFKLDSEDPDELVVVTLPCKHPFHEGCILPWLKSSGTCPVCRFALIPQPQQMPPGGPSGGPSSSNSDPPNPPSASRRRSSGNADRGGGGGGGGLFQAIFGGGAGASSRHGEIFPARSRGNHNIHPEVISHTTPSFPGQWIEDID